MGLAAAAGLMTLCTATAVRAETAGKGASDAARQVIEGGPYQRTFPGESGARKQQAPRRGGTGAPGWRPPSGLMPSRATADAASSALTAVGVVLGAVVGLGILLAVWGRLLVAWRKRQPPESIEDVAPASAATVELSSVDRMIQEARALLMAGEGREAVVFLWRRGVAVLSQAAPRDPGADDDLTGREVVRALEARGGTTTSRLDALKILLREMERAWFGGVSVTEPHFCKCEAAFRAVFEPEPSSGEAAA